MKKTLVFSLALVSLLMIGCGGKSKEEKAKDYEAVMEQYARNYYETYILGHVEGLDVPEISIESLQNANENGGANYDLSKLSGCTNDSKVSLILAENKRDIKSVEFSMNCK